MAQHDGEACARSRAASSRKHALDAGRSHVHRGSAALRTKCAQIIGVTRQRHDSRDDDGEGQRQREFAEQAADDAAHEQQRE